MGRAEAPAQRGQTASRTWNELKSLAVPHGDPASRPAWLLAGGRRVSGAPGTCEHFYSARLGEGGARTAPLWALDPIGGWDRVSLGDPQGVCMVAWVLLLPRSEDPRKTLGSVPRFLFFIMTEAKSWAS